MRSRSVMEGLQVTFTYIGAVIGAGFATGQEIVRFFSIYGPDGVKGCLFAGVMLALAGALIVQTAVQERITNYRQYVEQLFGGRLILFFDVLLALFLYGGLVVMFVAGGSLFTQLFSLPGWTGFLITGIFIYFTLLMGEEGILWLNTAMVPGIIILIIFVAGWGTHNYQINIMKNPGVVPGWPGEWIYSAILYVSYNLILGMTVLSSLDIKKAASGIAGAIVGGIFLGCLAALICAALLVQGSAVSAQEIPMLALSAKVSPFAVWVYSFVLWTAILTTAVGNAFGLFKRMSGRLKWPRPLLALLVILPAALFVDWQLSAAIGTIYPLLGYSGLIFLGAIIYRGACALIRAFCPKW